MSLTEWRCRRQAQLLQSRSLSVLMRLHRANQGQDSQFQDAVGRESEGSPPRLLERFAEPRQGRRATPLRP